MDKYLQIKAGFEALQNEEKAAHESAYMRNKFKFYGIAAPERRAVYRDFLREEKKGGIIDREFLKRCWDDEHREFQYLVADYLSTMQKFLTYDDVPFIEQFIRTKQWWDSIDALDKIIGDIGLTDKRIDELMLRWSLDDDFWVRRVAIDHQICRKQKTDNRLLEMILVNNFGSSEFFINKAIGWSLRAYSRTNPEWVRCFIAKYGDRMNRLSIREGGKYV